MNKKRKLQIQKFLKKAGDKIGKSFTEFTKKFLIDHLEDWKGKMKDDGVWTEEDQIAHEMFIHVIELLED